jgi:microcompartment protein CcmL/EutN
LSDAEPGTSVPQFRPRWIRIIAVVLVVVAVIVLGVLFIRSITARLASARKIDSATVIAKKVDGDVVAIDQAVRSPIDEQSAETKTLAARRIPRARAQLKQVVALADQAYEDLNDDEREAAVLLRATAAARLEMLALAEPILKADAQAATAADDLTSGWDQLVAAKGLSKNAAAQYNKLTKPAVTQSSKLLGQARSKLASASADFEAAAGAFPSLDAKPYLTYIATLRQLNSLAIQSNQAWLKGQTAQANVFTTRYNILEKQALEQASALPSSPNKAIAEAYDQATSRDLQEYVVARKKATEADTRLRQR